MGEGLQVKRVSCWCYTAQRQVHLEGRVVGKRQADLLKISDCECKDCPKRYAVDCLIGKMLESRWL
jgi:hypothetical protein